LPKTKPAKTARIAVIIPAFNEEASIANVLGDIPRDLVNEIIVVNNDSDDATAEIARRAGATVIDEPQRGYGKACLTGIARALKSDPEIIVFLDGDYSDFPEEMANLVAEIQNGYDMVIGSRVLGNPEKGALLPQARWGNLLAVTLIRVLFGQRYTDLGPFRAIRAQALTTLQMRDEDFGWTVEMQVKAAKKRLKITEVPVSYRKRIGVSKVTGTVSGTLRAGYKILFTIFKYAFFAG